MNKQNNKGFTLVEIIVAIAVLGVIVVPLLRGFVTTSALNQKSKQMMMASNAAQTIMEQFTGCTIEEVHNALVADPVSNPFVRNLTDYKYTYSMPNVQYNGVNFDARVILDTSDYYAADDSGYNQVKYPVISSIDISKDAIYAENDQVADKAFAEFVARNLASSGLPGKTVEQFKDNCEREIILDIEKVPDGASFYKKVTITYKYIAPVGYVDNTQREYEKSLILFSDDSVDAANRVDLRNLYLMYRPYYDGLSETIIINNKDNLKVNVYLIKQVTDTDVSALRTAENGYRVNVKVYETPDPLCLPGTSSFEAATDIFSNFTKNIADDTDISSQLNLLYYDNHTSLSYSGSCLKSKYFTDTYDKDRIYNMTVEIYKDGAAGSGFAADQKIAEFTR